MRVMILPSCAPPALPNNMPHFTITRRVKLTPDQAYAIAADVASYKDFLPLLERSTVRGQKIKNADGETFYADMAIGYAKLGLRESFKSHVVCDEQLRTVTATSNDGPIKSLRAVWHITGQAAQQVDITFTVDYAFKSMMLQVMARGLMDFAAQKIMQAFEDRGRALYGVALS